MRVKLIGCLMIIGLLLSVTTVLAPATNCCSEQVPEMLKEMYQFVARHGKDVEGVNWFQIRFHTKDDIFMMVAGTSKHGIAFGMASVDKEDIPYWGYTIFYEYARKIYIGVSGTTGLKIQIDEATVKVFVDTWMSEYQKRSLPT